MIDRKSHGCDKCRGQSAGCLRQLGETDHNEYFDGKAKETVKDFECTECGAKWRAIKEWGVGGHGRSWSPIVEAE